MWVVATSMINMFRLTAGDSNYEELELTPFCRAGETNTQCESGIWICGFVAEDGCCCVVRV
jgi:hypothetical protein